MEVVTVEEAVVEDVAVEEAPEATVEKVVPKETPAKKTGSPATFVTEIEFNSQTNIYIFLYYNIGRYNQ